MFVFVLNIDWKIVGMKKNELSSGGSRMHSRRSHSAGWKTVFEIDVVTSLSHSAGWKTVSEIDVVTSLCL